MMQISSLLLLCLGLLWQDDYGVAGYRPQMTPTGNQLLIQEGEELRIGCRCAEGYRLQFSTEKLMNNIQQSEFHILVDQNNGTHTLIRPKTIRQDTGWYACAEEGIVIRNDEQTIDHPNENISWIYVYVNSSQPFLRNDQGEIVKVVAGFSFVVPCRPTSPNLPVIHELNHSVQNTRWHGNNSYDPRIGFIIQYVNVELNNSNIECKLRGTGLNDLIDWPSFVLRVLHTGLLDKPFIDQGESHDVVYGRELVLVCSFDLDIRMHYDLVWIVPSAVSDERFRNYTVPKQSSSLAKFGNDFESISRTSSLTIDNVDESYDGEYSCVATNSYFWSVQSTIRVTIQVPSAPYINISMSDAKHILLPESKTAQWRITIHAYPKAEWKWYCPNGTQINMIHGDRSSKYSHVQSGTNHHFSISNVIIQDRGNYTIYISNSHAEKSIVLLLTVTGRPAVCIDKAPLYYKPGQSAIFTCRILAHALSNLTWSYVEYPDFPSEEHFETISPSNIITKKVMETPSDLVSHLNVTINMTGDVKCRSCNAFGCTEQTKKILVSDVAGYFGIVGPESVIAGDNINLTCGASVYNFSNNVRWRLNYRTTPTNAERINTIQERTKFTTQSILQIRNVTESDSGEYLCDANDDKQFGTITSQHQLLAKDPSPSHFVNSNMNGTEIVIDLKEGNNRAITLVCLADGWPIPKVTWHKNDELMVENDQHMFSHNNTELKITHFLNTDSGRYSCTATNRFGKVQKYFNFKVTAKGPENFQLWASLIAAGLLLVVMLFWIVFQKHREKGARREFILATLQRFNAGDLHRLNPEVSIGDQAEHLPFDKKWEFPRELLKLDKVLGSGAFGIVRKAQAKSICRPEVITTVAVKFVRATACLNHMTALSRELKILAHLGQHLNIVNLLGACTRNVSYGELLVIVEFCRLGNLHDYLIRGRDYFVNEFAETVAENITGFSFSENCDIGEEAKDSDAGSETESVRRSINSTDKRAEPTNCVEDLELLQADQRSKYQGDCMDESLDPICMRDLVSWSWQVSRGMKYLGSRRIVHGDLAARNILLADKNVVKICDFGLAEALYTNDTHTKEWNVPLPVKWMAVESLRDRAFSVQSDIWSYGIVLWELFSLGATPYPGTRNEDVYERVVGGFRMAQPKYATEDIYYMMLQCWNVKPSERPSFEKLEDSFADLLDERVKTDYLDLANPYVQMNAKALANGERDYLTMSIPDAIRDTIETSLEKA